MSLGNADSFMRYGTGATSRTNMARGKWSSVGANSSCETTNPPTGGTHHLRVVPGTVVIEAPRDAYGAALTEVIHFGRFSPLSLPGANNGNAFWTLRDAANADQVSLMLYSTGHIAVVRGGLGGTQIAISDDAIMVGAAYQFIEWRVLISDTLGEVDVRYNGEPVAGLTGLTGLDTKATANAEVSQYVVARSSTSSSGNGSTWDVADEGWIIPDDGIFPDDFTGDTSYRFYRPNSDGALSDFTRNTGAADFDCIDDVTPDDDTTYIAATTAGQVSDFGVENLPGTAADIIGVIAVALARKTDAGSASMQMSVISAAASPATTGNGAVNPMNETYTYHQDIFAADPATGVAWTPTGFNAARLKFTKSV